MQSLASMGTGRPVFVNLQNSDEAEEAVREGKAEEGDGDQGPEGAQQSGVEEEQEQEEEEEKPLGLGLKGTSEGGFGRQSTYDVGDNEKAQADWEAAGYRGRFLGTVGAPKVDNLVEKAAADCASDPSCICDWAGTPRKCLFNYCCGRLAHGLGQSRADYNTKFLTRAQIVDAYNQAQHLKGWQDVCQPEQTYYSKSCAKFNIPNNDNRK
mmetsp:Transcript_41784/g.65268  ORF Transcript_41784/g.65268 Transcript_41784/m.65268 type:complete len:210 (+) Transcript_41784:311-940(+)